MTESEPISLDTSAIKQWRSIVTLVLFVFTNLTVLFPFHIPIYVPRPILDGFLDTLGALRVISPRQKTSRDERKVGENDKVTPVGPSRFVRLNFPMNFVTAPLIADLFLLAISAIGRTEVYGGTIGSNNISPIDIMVFFLTLAYIAISIDASGLIRWLAFKVLEKAGKLGHRLFFYLYAFFFCLGTFIGNDPIILSGTAFLAYMTRVSSNIDHPRAWIHSQFSVANIASAILVSSNPTNLVLSGAFNIKFINYTANMIVPVVATAILLFPFLLYIVFADPHLIPLSITMYELPEEARRKPPVNPNIPNARGNAEEEENNLPAAEKKKLLEQGKSVSLEEVMNPFLDKGGAAFGAIIMATTLITLLALNASDQSKGEHPVFWVTLPAAFVMFCWDLTFGWIHRKETREIANKGREEIKLARAEQAERESKEKEKQATQAAGEQENRDDLGILQPASTQTAGLSEATEASVEQKFEPKSRIVSRTDSGSSSDEEKRIHSERISHPITLHQEKGPTTLTSLVADMWRWSQETFPTVTAVAAHLPFALIPFAFCMFILVQGLVTKGWVPVFAYGWDHWVNNTGTVGAIAGMGFISVILCNFAGTNIGTTILLCRVIQTWQMIHHVNGIPITDRTFWGTVYGMALGVNFGAFSTAFSASLAGLLWRDILAKKHITVRRLEFARVNLPIISIAMAVGCGVLVGEVYVMRNNEPYDAQVTMIAL